MTIQQLRYFVSVVKTCNMHLSAEELHISESSLSIAIKALEDEMGTRFFRRSGKRLVLLPVGSYFAEEANRLLHEFDSLREELMTFNRGITETLNVAFELPAISKFLFNGFRNTHTNISLNSFYKIWTGSASIDQAFPNMDFYITSAPLNNPHFVSDCLYSCSFFVMMSKYHRLAHRKFLTMRELKNETFIVSTLGSNHRDTHERFFSNANINPARIIEEDPLHHLVYLLNYNCVILLSDLSFLTLYQQEKLAEKLGLAFVPLKDPFVTIGFYLSYETRVFSSAQSEFYNYCKEFLAFIREHTALPPEAEYDLSFDRSKNLPEKDIDKAGL